MARARRPTDRRIASRLVARRIVLGLSRTDLARRVGLTAAQIDGYERGADSISASKIWALAQALSLPVECFFDETLLQPAQLGNEELAELLAAMPVACRSRLADVAASLEV